MDEDEQQHVGSAVEAGTGRGVGAGCRERDAGRAHQAGQCDQECCGHDVALLVTVTANIVRYLNTAVAVGTDGAKMASRWIAPHRSSRMAFRV